MIGFVFAVTIQVCKWLKHVLRTFPPISSGPLLLVIRILLSHLHVQIRLMGYLGLNGGVPWLTNTDGELCHFCKNSVEDVSHFVSDCSSFRDNFESLWSNLSQKLIACNPSDGTQISHFISSLDRQQKIILLLEGFPLPFDGVNFTMINRFISSAVGKMHQLRKEMLRELEAPWLPK